MASIKLFENKKVRSEWNEQEQKWYFSVQDVIEVLTDTVDVKDYIKKMKKRDDQLNANWGTICPLVEMEAADGRRRKIQAPDAKGLLRIIQSIPSPKAEPFKLWLAQVGSDRLDEIENPKLATQRTRELYKLKGYPDDIDICGENGEYHTFSYSGALFKKQIDFSIPQTNKISYDINLDNGQTKTFEYWQAEIV